MRHCALLVRSSLSSTARALSIATVSILALAASVQTAIASPFTLGTGVGANLGCTPEVNCPNNDGDRDATFSIVGPNNGAGHVSVTNLTDAFSDAAFTYSGRGECIVWPTPGWNIGQLQSLVHEHEGRLRGRVRDRPADAQRTRRDRDRQPRYFVPAGRSAPKHRRRRWSGVRCGHLGTELPTRSTQPTRHTSFSMRRRGRTGRCHPARSRFPQYLLYGDSRSTSR